MQQQISKSIFYNELTQLLARNASGFQLVLAVVYVGPVERHNLSNSTILGDHSGPMGKGDDRHPGVIHLLTTVSTCITR